MTTALIIILIVLVVLKINRWSHRAHGRRIAKMIEEAAAENKDHKSQNSDNMLL